MVFSGGLLLLALMEPTTTGTSWCLFELVGFDFCPGEGLGHSIAYTFRGDITSALDAHFAGPAAVIILISRIVHIWYQLLTKSKEPYTEDLSWQH
ncbi:Protein of unknown function [Gracilimonas mengyeensis]|uniref:DUF2752 domain-containing protein n=2 Tax=Gracilimonas mengyeensis TaxID=1302730 RepID=A0A521AID0_9BACT|nr:Protein of unknown function [Gracilimonas mengyeensis]